MTTTRIESFAKYAGLATISVEWLALLLYYIQMPAYFDGSYPISYFATLPQTRFVFTICYTLAGIFFWIFIRYHLHKHYQAPHKIFAFSMILFITLAVTPYDPTNEFSAMIHSILGLTSTVFFVVGMYLLAKNANNKPVTYLTYVAILLSLMLLIAFFLSPKESYFIFAFEAGSWFIWQIWVLWISYYSYNRDLRGK